jgi:hypothetical protein
VAAKKRLRKVVDEVSPVRCVSGPGLIREEVWQDASGEVARYNLAFINHFLTAKDNGRVLGDDNQHGQHHRHFYGTVEPISITSFAELALMFYAEVDQLKEQTR